MKKVGSQSFANKILDKRGHYIYFVKGEEDDKLAWAYVRVDRRDKDMFEFSLNKEIVDLNKYGTPIYSGWGHTPPQNLVMAMRNKYV